MLHRRDFLMSAAALAVPKSDEVELNDIHSQLNATRVARVANVDSLGAIRRTLAQARREKKAVSIAGGRHAMGGQQFGTGTVHLNTRPLSRVLGFDHDRGLLEVEAGIQWPALVDACLAAQKGRARQWGIAQKQTGADRLAIAGTLSANAHGRGLKMKPFVADVESFTLVDASGQLRQCSRTENSELFRLAIGGYGLFGVIASAKLRLVPRQKIERVVEVRNIGGLMSAFEQRIAAGFLYGDFQFSIDWNSEDFLRKGVFSSYRPVDPATPIKEDQQELRNDDWIRLLGLAHADKAQAFGRYSSYYLSTNGQIYWSDTHQLSIYPDYYHRELDKLGQTSAAQRASEMITEIYVPRSRLEDFMEEVREDCRKNKVEVIYGTIRLIEKDDETFLAWAKHPYACVIFNLHTVHTPGGVSHAADAFRRLIDMAIRRGGSYYLTYHKWAARAQVETCYPRFVEFLRLKKKYDPEEVFQSEWYRHYRTMFA